MTGHPFGYPADTIGHHLEFTHPPERDHKRTAACTGCTWAEPAPGTGYSRGRQLHPRHLRWATPTENQADRRIDGTLPAATEAHHHLTWLCDQCGVVTP